MSKLVITLEKGYKIPEKVNNLTSDEWCIIIEYIDKLLKKHESLINNETHIETLRKELSDEYKEKLQKYKSENIQLKSDYADFQIRLRQELETELRAKISEELNARNKLELERQNLAEQSSAQKLQHLQSMNSELSITIKELQSQLNSRINEKDKYIDALRSDLTDKYNLKITELTQKFEDQRESIENKYLTKLNDKDSYLISYKTELENKFEQRMNDIRNTYEEKINTYITDRDIKIAQLQNSIVEERQRIQLKHDETISKLQQKLEERTIKITDKYEEKLISMRKEIEAETLSKYNSDLSKTQTLITEYQNTIKTLKEQLNNMSNISTNITNGLSDVLNTVKPLTKLVKGSNSEKGDLGESLIQNILLGSELYSDAIIKDMSSTSASGDIFFKWRQLKCLIEIKNKQRITKEDVDKFARDIIENKSTNLNINCGMFVTHISNSIPGRSRDIIQLDYIEGIPVIYIYIGDDPDLHYSIACLEKIVSTNSSSDEETKTLISYFKTQYADLLTYQKYFAAEVKNKKLELKRLEKHLLHFNTSIEKLSNVYIKYVSNEDATNEAAIEANTIDANDGVPKFSKTSKPKLKKVLRNVNPSNSDSSSDSDSSDSDSSETKTPAIKLSSDPSIAHNQLKKFYLSFVKKSKTIPKINDFTNNFTNITIDTTYKETIKQIQNELIADIIDSSTIEKIRAFRDTHDAQYPNRLQLKSENIISENNIKLITNIVQTKKPLNFILNYVKERL